MALLRGKRVLDSGRNSKQQVEWLPFFPVSTGKSQ